MAYEQNVDDNGLVVCQCEDVAGTAFTNVKATAGNAMYVSVQDFAAGLEDAVKGTVAHGTADADAPVKTGGKANAAEPVAVDENDVVNASLDLYGNQKVVGNVAADAADRGCPVKVGGIGNATANTLDEGDRGDLSMDLNSQVRVVADSVTKAADAAFPSAMLAVGFRGNAAKPTADDEGDIIAPSVDLQGQLRTIIPDAMAVQDAAAPASALFVGGLGNAAAPTAQDEGDILPISTDLQGSQRMIGNLAHDAVDAGKPVKIGGYAKAAAPSAVSGDADRVNAWFDRYGRLTVWMDQVYGVAAAAIPAGVLMAGGSDGTNARAIKVDSSGNVQVETLSTPYDATIGSAVPATGAAIAVTDGTNARLLKGDSAGVPFIQGSIAHDEVDSGNPVKIGGYAKAAAPTIANADGDRVNAWFDRYGRITITSDQFLAAADAAFPGSILGIGGRGNAAKPTAEDEGDIVGLSVDLQGQLRTIQPDTTAVLDAAAPASALQIGGLGNAAKHAADDEGDILAWSMDLTGQGRVIIPDVTAVQDAAAPISSLMVGGLGNAAVPAAQDEGDLVPLSVDLRGVVRGMGDIAHGEADAGAPLKVGATATAALQSAVTEGDRSQLSTDLYGQLRTMKQERSVSLHTAGAVTAGASDTAVTGTGMYTHAEFLFNLTAAANVAGDTLDVLIDASPDGGTTWVNVVHFTQCVGDGGAKKYVAAVHSAANLTDVDVTSDLAAHDAPRSFLGNALRCRYAIVDGGAHGQSFNFVVTAVLKQS